MFDRVRATFRSAATIGSVIMLALTLLCQIKPDWFARANDSVALVAMVEGVEGLDFVVMNPPFHDGGAEDKALGVAFIEAAARMLARRGACWLVANRHLQAH